MAVCAVIVLDEGVIAVTQQAQIQKHPAVPCLNVVIYRAIAVCAVQR